MCLACWLPRLSAHQSDTFWPVEFGAGDPSFGQGSLWLVPHTSGTIAREAQHAFINTIAPESQPARPALLISRHTCFPPASSALPRLVRLQAEKHCSSTHSSLFGSILTPSCSAASLTWPRVRTRCRPPSAWAYPPRHRRLACLDYCSMLHIVHTLTLAGCSTVHLCLARALVSWLPLCPLLEHGMRRKVAHHHVFDHQHVSLLLSCCATLLTVGVRRDPSRHRHAPLRSPSAHVRNSLNQALAR